VTASLVEGNARFLATVRSGQVEVHKLAEDLNRKFIQINKVIDKKMVRQDEELDWVVGLVGEKIDMKMGELSRDLMEVLEIEENRRKDLEAKVVFLEEKLVNSLNHTADLVRLVISVQSRVTELEDAVMEESEEDDREVVSSSSSDLDPVENMVAIQVPAPSIVHTLVEIPEEFIPLSRLVPFGHVFGPLLSSFRTKFTRYSSHPARKPTKTSHNKIVLRIQQ
jgi:hypothetical protein